MKQISILSFLFILGLTTTIEAQTTTLKLEIDAPRRTSTKGSKKSSSTKSFLDLTISSAEYQEAASSNTGGGRPGHTSSESNRYTITRATDGHSNTIQSAANTGKIYKTGIISLSSGKSSTTIDLVNVYISNYAPNIANGQATESFDVLFQTQNISSN